MFLSKKRIYNFFKDPAKLIIFISGFRLFRIIPDKLFLKILFRAKLKYRLNLNKPSTFNEKIQWLKLFDRNQRYTAMVDKYDAKKYVGDLIGDEFIVENYGVWDNFEDIDFDALPEQFVLKCTHDCGGLVVCRDKKMLDKKKAEIKINKALKNNYYWGKREWPYKNVRPRIIAEKYLENSEVNNTQGIIDYKFFCFNGKAEMIYISLGLENHETAKISFYDLNGKEMNFRRSDYAPIHNFVLPDNFGKMKELAEIIAEDVDCPFVRVDLYSVKNHIYFSEITFSPCSGYVPFDPPEVDYELGKLIKLPTD